MNEKKKVGFDFNKYKFYRNMELGKDVYAKDSQEESELSDIEEDQNII